MGYYIQGPALGKADFIVNNYGATKLPNAPKWEEIPEDKAAICVVNNGPFEAAGFAYNPKELAKFSRTFLSTYKDDRPKQWLLMDRKKAEELTNFSPKS